jgi:hypothetical protein
VTRGEAWTLHVASALVGGTGLVYAWMRYLVEPADEFALANHPLEPVVQHAHVLVAPLLVFGAGLIFQRHVWARLASGFRPRRPTGVALALLLVPMVLSGYALQTSSHESWRRAWILVHAGTSFAWLGLYAAHLLSPRPPEPVGAAGPAGAQGAALRSRG